MVDASVLRALRWALIVTGILGLSCSAVMLLVTLTQFAKSLTALHITEGFPAWVQWTSVPPAAVTMLIVGALCALLLVIGRWPIKVCAALLAAWFAYAQAEFASGSSLSQQVAQTFDYTPLYRGALVGVAALAAVSVLAILLAALPTRMAQASLAGATEARS